MVLLLDTSGSMGGSLRSDFGPKWTKTLLAADAVLRATPQQSPVALVTFSDQVNLSGFETRQEVEQKLIALKNTKPHGRTALYGAVHHSIQLFGTPQFGDSVFIVSDAVDDYGLEKRKDVAAELIERGIRSFAFVIQDPVGGLKPPEAINGPSDLFEFVKLTGGNYVSPQIPTKWFASKDEVELLQVLRNQIQSPYRLDLQLAASPQKAVKLKITTTVKDLELAYPERIEPCSVAAAALRP